MMRVVFAVTIAASSAALAAPMPTPFSSAPDSRVPPPWQVITLPKIPRHTQYEIVTLDGKRVVKAEADGSYANVVHPLHADVATTPVLRWSWRVDRFPAASDLSLKAGDDVAAKVCVLFDLPLDRLGLIDRLKIELGRRLFKLDLPAATVCYVWERTLASGTWLPNVYTDRVRMLVLRSAAAGEQGRWFDERRDLRADFARAFGTEAAGGLPPISAIAFASDADNTGSTALAYFGDILLVTE
ncbi:MAG TPA: DUF3047 domain-containing protein [Burkholderiaceae bacterium]|nr:DUF3047 domain-containing protein [Burkholderiaceae bacterium]